MQGIWPFLLALAVGATVCFLIGRWLISRWGLPLRQALMYFGLLPHPEEDELPSPPSRREVAERQRRAERRRRRSRARRDRSAAAPRTEREPPPPE